MQPSKAYRSRRWPSLAWLGGARWLSLALAASSLGDVLLDVGPETLFVPGLVAFLVAHLLYTVAVSSPPAAVVSAGRSLLAAASRTLAAVFAIWLAPGLGPLRIPVALYICVITGMVVSALYASVPRTVPLGALLFLISDSILAIGKFKTAIPFGGFLVWGTYYAAQYLIATGILQAVTRREQAAEYAASSRRTAASSK